MANAALRLPPPQRPDSEQHDVALPERRVDDRRLSGHLVAVGEQTGDEKIATGSSRTRRSPSRAAALAPRRMRRSMPSVRWSVSRGVTASTGAWLKYTASDGAS